MGKAAASGQGGSKHRMQGDPGAPERHRNRVSASLGIEALQAAGQHAQLHARQDSSAGHSQQTGSRPTCAPGQAELQPPPHRPAAPHGATPWLRSPGRTWSASVWPRSSCEPGTTSHFVQAAARPLPPAGVAWPAGWARLHHRGRAHFDLSTLPRDLAAAARHSKGQARRYSATPAWTGASRCRCVPKYMRACMCVHRPHLELPSPSAERKASGGRRQALFALWTPRSTCAQPPATRQGAGPRCGAARSLQPPGGSLRSVSDNLMEWASSVIVQLSGETAWPSTPCQGQPWTPSFHACLPAGPPHKPRRPGPRAIRRPRN